jgi:hypothetical protein
MAYTKYSLTPADNNAAPPNGAPEGMLPSAVNDTMRDMMAQIRDLGDGIRGGTYTMTAPVITGGSVTGVTALSTSGSLAFTGTGNRITGDYSNATVANRMAFQSSVTNGSTNITMLPNGTSQATTVNFEGTNDGLNCSTFQVGQTATVAQLNASIRGTGTYLPLVMNTGGSERLRIDTSGNLLLNTTAARAGFFNSSANSPIAQIEGTTTNSTALSVVRNTADTAAPFLILGKTRGTAVGATTAVAASDNLGIISFQGSDGTELVECARILGRVDGTPGANDMPGALVFQTTADGAASSTERMRITSAGDLLVGTTSEAGFVTIQNPTANKNGLNIICSSTSASNFVLALQSNASIANTSHLIRGYSNTSTGVFFVAGNGNVTNTNNSYGAISDSKLKENIVDATPKLEKLLQVRVRSYNLKGDYEQHKQIGVVAQELEEVFPLMIEESPDRDSEGNEIGTTTKSVKYSVFVPMLIKAMQEQQIMIDELKAKVAALEAA